MLTCDQIVARLESLADDDVILQKEKKFGIKGTNMLGIYHRDLNALVKEIGKNSTLALALYDSGIYEARLLTAKIFNPKDLTTSHMEEWITIFNNWEICDTFCMAVFSRSELAIPKIHEWASREPEFEKRASFATLAGLCSSDKKSGNALFEATFPLIYQAAPDDRLYVKKAVSWALRSIGKRNRDLQKSAIAVANELHTMPYKSAQWIANDVLKELQQENVRMSDYPRAIYRSSCKQNAQTTIIGE